VTTLYEHREQRLRPDAAVWDLVEFDDVTVTEKQLEPAEFERLKAEWLGREHGPSDRMG
jgi:hypothetical protein